MVAATRRSRWYVAGRTASAILLGYVFASTAGLAFALTFGDRISGVLAGTIATFLIWGAAIMWAFAVEKTRTVLLGLGSGILITAGLSWAFYSAPGPV